MTKESNGSIEPGVHFLRFNDVKKLTGMSQSTIYNQMKRGMFPQSIRIGLRMVAWRSCDIEVWKNGLLTQSLPPMHLPPTDKKASKGQVG